MNPGLKVTGIVLTMFDGQTRLSNEVLAELNKFADAAEGKNLPWSGMKIFKSRVRRNIKLAESPSFGQHIIQYDASSNGAADYRALARELLGMPPEAPATRSERATGATAAVMTEDHDPTPTTPAPKAPKAARKRGGKKGKVEVTINDQVDPSTLAATHVDPVPEVPPAEVANGFDRGVSVARCQQSRKLRNYQHEASDRDHRRSGYGPHFCGFCRFVRRFETACGQISRKQLWAGNCSRQIQ